MKPKQDLQVSFLDKTPPLGTEICLSQTYGTANRVDFERWDDLGQTPIFHYEGVYFYENDRIPEILHCYGFYFLDGEQCVSKVATQFTVTPVDSNKKATVILVQHLSN